MSFKTWYRIIVFIVMFLETTPSLSAEKKKVLSGICIHNIISQDGFKRETEMGVIRI